MMYRMPFIIPREALYWIGNLVVSGILLRATYDFYLKAKLGSWLASGSRYFARRRIKSLSRQLVRLQEMHNKGQEWALGHTIEYGLGAVLMLVSSLALMVIAAHDEMLCIFEKSKVITFSRDNNLEFYRPSFIMGKITILGAYGVLVQSYLYFRRTLKYSIGISTSRLKARQADIEEERTDLINKHSLPVVDKSSVPVLSKPESSV